jgi:prohibitin 1
LNSRCIFAVDSKTIIFACNALFVYCLNSFTMRNLSVSLRLVLVSFVAIMLLGSGCRVVRQGELGVKRKLGRYSDKVYTGGLQTFNPFTSTIIKISGQTENLEVTVSIPSREGLTIQSEVSILYAVRAKSAPELLRNVGLNYEETVILPVFRSAVADVTSKYYAKDMHSGGRSEIEVSIKDLMMKTLESKGIIVEAVLLKSIVLPRNLTQAIEDKLEAEQQAQRMEFILQQERLVAERTIITATATRDANKIISEGLTPAVLQFKNIEAWLQLSQSNNAKVIITQGNQMQMMVNPADLGIK